MNIGAFMLNLAIAGRKDIVSATEAIGASFTTTLILPIGNKTNIIDQPTLDDQISMEHDVSCNCTSSLTATVANAGTFDQELITEVKSMYHGPLLIMARRHGYHHRRQGLGSSVYPPFQSAQP